MTIQKEEPGVWVVYCDTCGDRRVLDTDGDAPREEAVEEIESIGFTILPTETMRFKKGERESYSETYERHSCRDC